MSLGNGTRSVPPNIEIVAESLCAWGLPERECPYWWFRTWQVAAIRHISHSCLHPNDFTVVNCIVKGHASLSPPSMRLRLCSRFTLLATYTYFDPKDFSPHPSTVSKVGGIIYYAPESDHSTPVWIYSGQWKANESSSDSDHLLKFVFRFSQDERKPEKRCNNNQT
ncbi:hypothetical protein TNCV_4804041 [Trichonephila clavipes]|nr:hypothetical protein TNCV_4804041 [Trichonephila clavipes]